MEENREEVKSKQHVRILYLLSSECIFKNILEYNLITIITGENIRGWSEGLVIKELAEKT